MVYSEDNKIGIITDLYHKIVTEINKGDKVNVAALGTVLKTMNDQAGPMLENLSFQSLYQVKQKPDLSFMPMPKGLTDSLGMLMNINEKPTAHNYDSLKSINARDNSLGAGSITGNSPAISKRYESPVKINDSPYHTLKSSYGEFESDPEYMKTQAKYKIKARLLCALSKHSSMDTRTAFIRWWIRTHKKYAKRTISHFVCKSKISMQVAFWRFKQISVPGKLKRNHYQQFMEQIHDFVEVVETRQKSRCIRNAFFRIKMVSECDKMINIFSSLNNLGS